MLLMATSCWIFCERCYSLGNSIVLRAVALSISKAGVIMRPGRAGMGARSICNLRILQQTPQKLNSRKVSSCRRDKQKSVMVWNHICNGFSRCREQKISLKIVSQIKAVPSRFEKRLVDQDERYCILGTGLGINFSHYMETSHSSLTRKR